MSLGCATGKNETKISLDLSFLLRIRAKEVLEPFVVFKPTLIWLYTFYFNRKCQEKAGKIPLDCLCPDAGTNIKLKRQQVSVDI